MKNRKFLFVLAGIAGVFVLICLACGVLVLNTASSPTFQATMTAQSIARVTPNVTSTPTSAPQPIPPPLPTSTLPPLTATPTQTPTTVPIKVSAKQTVNVRQGPGTQFAAIGKLQPNTSIVALAKSEDGQWLQIPIPDAANPGWVAVSVVSVTGATESLQVVVVVPSPTTTRLVVVVTKAPTAKPLSASVMSESEYATAYKKIMDDFSSAFGQLGKLLIDAGDNPSLMLDNVWVVKTGYNIVIIKNSNKQIRELKPPLRFVVPHGAVVEATRHYDKAMDLLVYALDHLDADKMKQAMDEIALGNLDMERATALIK